MRRKTSLLIGAGAALTVGVVTPALASASHAATPAKTATCNDGTVTWSPQVLWPPNHKMQTITIHYIDSDNDGDSTSITVGTITQNQVDPTTGAEDVGAGNPHLTDWSGTGNSGSATDPGTATTTAQVRAERSGPNGDRVYTIQVMCKDQGGADPNDPNEAVGQMGTADITVTVPHDQGHR